MMISASAKHTAIVAKKKTKPMSSFNAGFFASFVAISPTSANIALTEKYYIFERRYQGEKITAVCNFETPSKIDGSGYGEVLLDNYDGDGKGTFGPYRLVVYKKRKE